MSANETYITAAVGEPYLRLAKYQKRCMDKHGWQARHIIIDPAHGSYRGRDEKTGFVSYLPDDCAGVVILLDADCVIEGPEPKWDCVADVMGVGLELDGKGHHGFKDAPMPVCGRLDSMCLVFRNAECAKRVSAKWAGEWRGGCGIKSVWSDTYALQFALHGESCAKLQGASGMWPHPSILHRYTEAGRRQS